MAEPSLSQSRRLASRMTGESRIGGGAAHPSRRAPFARGQAAAANAGRIFSSCRLRTERRALTRDDEGNAVFLPLSNLLVWFQTQPDGGSGHARIASLLT